MISSVEDQKKRDYLSFPRSLMRSAASKRQLVRLRFEKTADHRQRVGTVDLPEMERAQVHRP